MFLAQGENTNLFQPKFYSLFCPQFNITIQQNLFKDFSYFVQSCCGGHKILKLLHFEFEQSSYDDN